MVKKSLNQLHNLLYKNVDILIAIGLTLVVYLIKIIFKIELMVNYTILIPIFIGIFTVNLAIFALTKFLIENYHKIRSEQTKRTIDAIYRTPVKTSLIGIILSILFYTLNISFVYFLQLAQFNHCSPYTFFVNFAGLFFRKFNIFT